MNEQETITAELGVNLPPGLDTIMGFYDAEVVGLVHASNAFTVREHFQRLIQLAQSPDSKTSLAALKELRAARREVLELNGFIGLMKNERENSDGSRQEIVTHQIARMDSIVAALTDRRSSNGAGIPSPRILEAEVVSQQSREEGGAGSPAQAVAETFDDRHAGEDEPVLGPDDGRANAEARS
jgi:hypothetical protein